jgi:uncharacterized protein (TIGR03437 family)
MKRTIISLAVAFPTLLTAQPAIRSSNGILNASGYQAQLAPGTVFVIFGSALGPAAIQTAPASGYPTVLAGTSVTFTPAGGGTPIDAKIVYTLATQVAGILPSSIPPGSYAVTVLYNGRSSPPQNAVVVARSFGIATSNSAGTGEAQATIGNVNGGISLVRQTSGSVSFGGYSWTLSPAHPGDTLVLWGTGGGADPANDAGGTSGDQTAVGRFSVDVAGTSIVPLYAGTSAGYPGLWQINFALPPTIQPDCAAGMQVSASGQLSNRVTIAIAQTGQASCPLPNLNGVWSGAASDSSGPGTMTWKLTQTGVTVNGTMQAATPSGAIAFSGSFSGTLNGSTLPFTINVAAGGVTGLPSCTVTMNGTVTSITPSTLSGTYSGSSCGGPFSNGQFKLTKQ